MENLNKWSAKPDQVRESVKCGKGIITSHVRPKMIPSN